QEIFDILEPITLAPDQLDAPPADATFCKVVFKEGDMVEPIDSSQPFELQDYYKHPEKYRGVFERYLPNLHLLINCIYWEPKYPRLATKEAIRKLFAQADQPRLRVIGDISCDPEGSIEVTSKPTDPGNPVYVYDTNKDVAVDGFEGHGPVIMAVEILPTELPRESSAAFSDALVGMIPGLVANPAPDSFDDWNLPAPLKKAVILHRGQLTSDFAYLKEYL
ncbi:MAG: hypothetical protein GXP29_02115, partial [Planctomycetes bacterium]|nr:hypothetical protein [Planctomycetota bacterium]